MALTPKNWTVSSYTNSTWTALVAEPAQLAAITIANTGALATVEIQLDDGAGVELARVLPASDIDTNESYTLDLRSLNVTGTQRLRVQVSVAGVHFVASGVV